MAVLKVIELMASSDKGWEDASNVAVKMASKTVKGIKSIWVKDISAVVKDNKIVEYRVDVKVSFEVLG
jgi:flavin-binding protein dodecin